MSYIYMLRNLWKYAGKERWKIIVYILFHTISASGPLIQPYAIGQIFNTLQKNDINMMILILKWALVYALGFVIFEVFHRSARFIEQRLAFQCRQNFTADMYSMVYHLPMKWHTDNHSGKIINRIMKAGEGLSDFGQMQYNLINMCVCLCGPLIILFRVSYNITVISIILLVISSILIFKFDKILVPLIREQNEVLHRFSAVFFDYVSNIKTILTLRLGKETGNELNKKYNLFYPLLMKEIKWTQIKCFFMSLAILLINIGIILYYIYKERQTNNAVMIGTVAAIYQYLKQLTESFGWFAGNYYSIVRRKTDFRSVYPIIKAYEQHHLPEGKNIAAWNNIKISRLNFSYDSNNHAELTLNNITLDLRRGSRIALVGESGSGKSTILNIIRGLYEAEDAICNIDDKTSNLSVLSSITTLVPQEPEIFENTIQYNISVGVSASESDIDKAIDLARFRPVLNRMPNGLDTDIREKGVNLSGGEKQRLALARGILAAKHSPILLLDEPTSSVDAHNEMLIYENIFREYNDKCIISSIHRLHLLDYFDMVYVLDSGRVVQYGSFEGIKTHSGQFKKLRDKHRNEDKINK